jgi:hypothetical protein
MAQLIDIAFPDFVTEVNFVRIGRIAVTAAAQCVTKQ